MPTKTCYKCIYFNQCGDPSRTEPCDGREVITQKQAKEFYRDLRGSFGNKDGIVSYDAIAGRMDIPVPKVKAFCQACFRYGITEKQGGGVVI